MDGDTDWLAAFRPRLSRKSHAMMFDYWCAIAPPGGLPGRHHFDPVEVPAVLPWLTLVDVVRTGPTPRYRYRLIGSGVTARVGRDDTGSWLDEVYDAVYLDALFAAYAEVLGTKRPHLSSYRFPTEERKFVRYDRLILPLASDSATVDMLILVLVFTDKPEKSRH